MSGQSSQVSLIESFERTIRVDVGRRGLIDRHGGGPGQGELLEACRELAKTATRAVCLVTGFFVPGTSESSAADSESRTSGSAETDGPPGTALLARLLCDLGISVRIVTDERCAPVVRVAASVAGLPAETVLACPHDSTDWRREFLTSSFGSQMTHLVAIERVGPSHTIESIRLAARTPAVVQDFHQDTDIGHHDRCFNMRGEPIDVWTGDLHRLFDDVHARRPEVRTIGVGDGGNEIGMGRFCWSELRSLISGGVGNRLPCRIATHHTIVAGVSNWGAYALAAGVSLLRQRPDVLRRHSVASQSALLDAIVSEAGAVDGITRLRQPTVDGLDTESSLHPLDQMLRSLD